MTFLLFLILSLLSIYILKAKKKTILMLSILIPIMPSIIYIGYCYIFISPSVAGSATAKVLFPVPIAAIIIYFYLKKKLKNKQVIKFPIILFIFIILQLVLTITSYILKNNIDEEKLWNQINNKINTIDNNEQIEDFKALKVIKETETGTIIDNLYRNYKYGFSIQFPKGWNQLDGDGEPTVVIFYKNNSHIMISVDKLPKGIADSVNSINEIYSVEDIKKMAKEAITKSGLTGKLINVVKSKIDNHFAYLTFFSATSPNSNTDKILYYLVYSVLKDNMEYDILITSTSEEYDLVKKDINQSIFSFAFENWKL